MFWFSENRNVWKKLSDFLDFLCVVRDSWKLQIDLIILVGCGHACSSLLKVLWNNKSPMSLLFAIGSCFKNDNYSESLSSTQASLSNYFVVFESFKTFTCVWPSMSHLFSLILLLLRNFFVTTVSIQRKLTIGTEKRNGKYQWSRKSWYCWSNRSWEIESDSGIVQIS